jgi:hypothetical protein
MIDWNKAKSNARKRAKKNSSNTKFPCVGRGVYRDGARINTKRINNAPEEKSAGL